MKLKVGDKVHVNSINPNINENGKIIGFDSASRCIIKLDDSTSFIGVSGVPGLLTLSKRGREYCLSKIKMSIKEKLFQIEQLEEN